MPASPVRIESKVTEPACTPDLKVKSKALQNQFDETLQQQLEVGIKKPPLRPSVARAQKAESEEVLMRAWEEVALTSHAAETGDKDILKSLPTTAQLQDASEKPTQSSELTEVDAMPLDSISTETLLQQTDNSISEVFSVVEESSQIKSELAANEHSGLWCTAPSVGTWLLSIVQENPDQIKEARSNDPAAAVQPVLESATPSRARRPRLTSKKRQTPNNRSPARMSSPAALRVPPHSNKKELDTDLPQELFPAPVLESEVSIKPAGSDVLLKEPVKPEEMITEEMAEAQQLEAEAKKEMEEAQKALSAQKAKVAPSQSTQCMSPRRCTSPKSPRQQAVQAQSPNRLRSQSPQGRSAALKVSASSRELREAKTSKASAQMKAATSVSSLRPRSPTPTKRESPQISAKGAAKPAPVKAPAAVPKVALRSTSPGSGPPRRVASAAASRVSPSRERPGSVKAKGPTSPRPMQPDSKAKAPAVAAAKSTGRVSPSRQRPPAVAKAKGSMSPRHVQVGGKVKDSSGKGPEQEVATELSVSKKQSTQSSAELEAAKIEAHMKEMQKLKERNARTMQRMAAKRAAAKENCENSNVVEEGKVIQNSDEARAPLGEINPSSKNSPQAQKVDVTKKLLVTAGKVADTARTSKPGSVEPTAVATPVVPAH
eukprot:gnl/MRDRNA2_/MRDRNA2_98840_c0_seq1.p1 gnl/MRDRNA2_/MRDRNA2_98840_c0~~gnl/MRDRNA2_/MRDRNA2_98840_c0_seq1.p1  ORF type:complete len:659 (-),score=189.08 gnl/MRDRNA2_/MRDRNA2_98840_c0_seq1:58-2034(-)